MHPVATRLHEIVDRLNQQYYERRQVIDAMVLAVLAKEHVFILGPPGTGKSQLARGLLRHVTGASYYEQLLSKTRPDQAVLGPYNLPKLRDEGAFERRIDGFLLTAEFAFLDEIGKMSPTLGHDLLAALNERVRHEVHESGSVHPIPLHTAVTASNELVAHESDDAAALWDRLLVRVVVDYISDDGSFAQLMGRAQASGVRSALKPPRVEYGDLLEVCDVVVPSIKLPDEVLDAVVRLRHELAGHSIRVSDRRWRASMRLLQAAAFMEGREYCEVDDLAVLRFTLWDTPEQLRVVERAALKVANPLNEELAQIDEMVASIGTEVAAKKGKSLAERAGYGSEAITKLTQLTREVETLQKKHHASPRNSTRLEELALNIHNCRALVFRDMLNMEEM